MTREEELDTILNRISQAWAEYLDTGNALDKLSRINEVRSYLRLFSLRLEALENQAFDAVPFGRARKMLRKYNGSNT